VVLAVALDTNVAQHHEIVIAARFLELAVENIGRVLVVAREIFGEGVGDAARRVAQPSRAGSSPAQAIRVRTAASASARVGRFTGRRLRDAVAFFVAMSFMGPDAISLRAWAACGFPNPILWAWRRCNPPLRTRYAKGHVWLSRRHYIMAI
jgi:hypothetical protein